MIGVAYLHLRPFSLSLGFMLFIGGSQTKAPIRVFTMREKKSLSKARRMLVSIGNWGYILAEAGDSLWGRVGKNIMQSGE